MNIAIFGNGTSRFALDWYGTVSSAVGAGRYPGLGARTDAVMHEVESALVDALENLRVESNALEVEKDAFPSAVKAVAFLAAKGYYDLVVTTNYDAFIDRALTFFSNELHARPIAKNPCLGLAAPHTDYAGLLTTPPAIDAIHLWKIHGDASVARWTCCDKLEAVTGPGAMVYKPSGIHHPGCTGYQVGQCIHFVLLAEALAHDIAHLFTIDSAFHDVLAHIAANSPLSVDVLGYAGRKEEYFASALAEGLIGIGHDVEVNYVNPELSTHLPQTLQSATNPKLAYTPIAASADDWLDDLVGRLGYRAEYDTYNRP